jgi:hypothetical protein
MDPGSLPVFFIVGRGRSGSTLLRFLFDAHPHVMIPMESRFVQFLFYHYAHVKQWTGEKAERAVRHLGRSFEPPELQTENLQKQIRAHGSDLSFASLCKLIYLNTRTGHPKKEIRALGDKNPRYTFFLPTLLQIFPEARFIHLIRDYRDNVAAIQRAANIIRESGNPLVSLGRWKLYNRTIARCRERYPDQFCTVRFEDLVARPEEEMKRVCGFLGLDFIPQMLNYRHKVELDQRDENFRSLHRSLELNFDASKIGEWRRVLDRKTVIRCEALAGSFPLKFGYKPELDVKPFRRFWIKLIFLPVYLPGQIRYALKIPFYRSRRLMQFSYWLLLKMKRCDRERT